MSQPVAYVILIGPTPDGHYGAWAPDLPGCIALGATVEDTKREMREAAVPRRRCLRQTRQTTCCWSVASQMV